MIVINIHNDISVASWADTQFCTESRVIKTKKIPRGTFMIPDDCCFCLLKKIKTIISPCSEFKLWIYYIKPKKFRSLPIQIILYSRVLGKNSFARTHTWYLISLRLSLNFFLSYYLIPFLLVVFCHFMVYWNFL